MPLKPTWTSAGRLGSGRYPGVVGGRKARSMVGPRALRAPLLVPSRRPGRLCLVSDDGDHCKFENARTTPPSPVLFNLAVFFLPCGACCPPRPASPRGRPGELGVRREGCVRPSAPHLPDGDRLWFAWATTSCSSAPRSGQK